MARLNWLKRLFGGKKKLCYQKRWNCPKCDYYVLYKTFNGAVNRLIMEHEQSHKPKSSAQLGQ